MQWSLLGSLQSEGCFQQGLLKVAPLGFLHCEGLQLNPVNFSFTDRQGVVGVQAHIAEQSVQGIIGVQARIAKSVVHQAGQAEANIAAEQSEISPARVPGV